MLSTQLAIENSYRLGSEVLVTLQILNSGAFPKSVNSFIILDEGSNTLKTTVFNITDASGNAAKYHGMFAKTHEDEIVIPAHSSREFTIKMGKEYFIPESGKYFINLIPGIANLK